MEDPLYTSVRNTALKCTYRIVVSLINIPKIKYEIIQKGFFSIGNLYSNLFQFLREHLENIAEHQVLQNAIYALVSLALTCRYNTDAVDSFVSKSSTDLDSPIDSVDISVKTTQKPLLSIVQSLAKVETVSLYCIQIQEIICHRPKGLLLLSMEDNKSILISELERFGKKLTELADVAAAAAIPPGKGGKEAPAKKEEKGKKGVVAEPVHTEHKEVLEQVLVEPKRNIACMVKLCCKIFTEMAVNNSSAIDEATARRVGKVAGQLLVTHGLWEVVREPDGPPWDESAFDVVEELCIMVGSIGAVSQPMRMALCNNGCLQSLVTVMQQSRPIVTGTAELSPSKAAAAAVAVPAGKHGKHAAAATPSVAPAPMLDEKQQSKLFSLRRVCEKAILSLSGDQSTAVVKPDGARWRSALKFKTEMSLVVSEGESSGYSYVTELLELVAMQNDDDLASRGVRIVSALILGCSNPAAFIHKIGLGALFATVYSGFCLNRGQKVLDKITATPVYDAIESTATEESKSLDDTIVINSDTTEESTIDLLIPSKNTESLYLAYCIVETFLTHMEADCKEAVKTFATAEQVKVISSLLQRLGPSGSNSVAEFQSTLYDPRVYSWRPKIDEKTVEKVFLRPIMLKVLALSATADSVYRKLEVQDSAIPPLPCTAMPLSKSPCEEASLYVCKYCTDSVYAILSTHCEYSNLQSNIIAIPVPGMKMESQSCSRLEESVLIAALEYACAIASCGPIGIAATLEAVAESGFKMLHSDQRNATTAVFTMKNFYSFMNSEESAFSDVLQSVPENFLWTRPKYFDDVFDPDHLLTATNQVGHHPILWPFISICGSIIAVFADPKSTQSSAQLAVEVLISTTKYSMQHAHSQPVLYDIMSAVFLSLGGGVALNGLMGRFGNISESFKDIIETHMEYLLYRGSSREGFWHEWNVAHKEEIVLDPKTGKPIHKKEDKKAKETKPEKKVDPKAIPPVIIVPEVHLNFESNDQHPDPNHGPNEGFWLKLLNVCGPNLYQVSNSQSMLISGIQGNLGKLSIRLIELGVSLDVADEFGLTALMYSFVYNEVEIAQTLVEYGANVNAVDNNGNPAIKFALLSLSLMDIKKQLPCHVEYNKNYTYTIDHPIQLFGTPHFHNVLLDTQIRLPQKSAGAVDVNVRDPSGRTPLLVALGQGEVTLKLGGYAVRILSGGYNDSSYPIADVHKTVRDLLKAGGWLNACSKRGVVPMHIVAARGDLEMIKLFAAKKAIINPVDGDGLLPLHFLSACCPPNAITVFDELMSISINRSIDVVEYDDYRTGRSTEEKEDIQLKRHIQERFVNAFVPEVISKKRLSYSDLLHTKTSTGLNILQLCMCAPTVLKDDVKINSLILIDKRDERIDYSLHLAQCAIKCDGGEEMFSNIDIHGMSVLHSCCFMLQGVTPQRELTDKEKRSKRVKTYPSKEIHILELISSAPNYDINSWFEWNGEFGIPLTHWNVMLIALKNNNPNLIPYFMQRGFDLVGSGIKYMHLAATSKSPLDIDVLQNILNACAAQPSYKILLNEAMDTGLEEAISVIRRPLMMAVHHRNMELVKILVRCPKVDLNAVDEVTGMTAFHEACLTQSVELVSAFAAASDRLDMLLSVLPGQNAVAAVINSGNLPLLQQLMDMRKNDVLECLLSENGPEGESSSLLIKLEQENLDLASELGYSIASGGDKSPGKDVLWKVQSMENSEEAKGVEEVKEMVDALEEHDDNNVDTDVEADEVDLNATTDSFEGLELQQKADMGELNQVEGLVTKKLKSDEEIEEIKAKLRKSNELLKVLIPLVNASGIVTSSYHAHAVYFSGQLPLEV